MKKLLLILLLFAFKANSQEVLLDTVQVRNVSLQARHWWYNLDWFEHAAKDSIDRIFFNKVRVASANKTVNQVVVIDSIPGKWAKRMVEIILTVPNGEGNAGNLNVILTELRTKAQLVNLINAMELVYTTEFIRKRKSGKDWAEQ